MTGVVTTGGVTTGAGEADPEPPQALIPQAEATSKATLHCRIVVMAEYEFFILITPFS
jgi:hypothetical protein